MPINDPRSVTSWRAPRPRLLIDGKPLFGVRSVCVTATNNFHGDRFSADIVGANQQQGVGSVAWWASQNGIRVTVQIGMVPAGGVESDAVWTDMLVGVVDRVQVDPFAGCVTIDGRDLTALLIDSGEGEVAVNQTASEAVTKIAESVGLTPVVTATTTLIGRFYQREYTSGNLRRGHPFASRWDAVVDFARQEGFDAFVSGTKLYFQPPVNEKSDPFLIIGDQKGSNVTRLCLCRALHLARGVKINVRSWSAATSRLVEASAAKAGHNTRTYEVVRPGLTQLQAETLAQRFLQELTRHEMTISGSMPGDLRLTPRVLIRLYGSNTAFDQAYFPDTVVYRVDERGFEVDFSAINKSPDVARS